MNCLPEACACCAGYSKIQGTKPQTLGYALNDSPVGEHMPFSQSLLAVGRCLHMLTMHDSLGLEFHLQATDFDQLEREATENLMEVLACPQEPSVQLWYRIHDCSGSDSRQ